MKRATRVRVLVALFVLAALGLVAPGLLGSAGVYVWLGVFPGMAIAHLLLPRAATLTRWTVGLVLSPLVSGVAGWALARNGLDLPAASRWVAIGGSLLFAGLEARSLGTQGAEPDVPPGTRFAWAWALGSVAFVAACFLVNPWSVIRSDAWVHAAIAMEIRLHGIPPADPRFVGLHMNYVWFFQFFIAQLASLRGQDVFTFMAILDVVVAGVMMWLVWQLAWELWEDERAARGALVLFTFGLNAGAYLLAPLQLLGAFTGHVTGWGEVRRTVAGMHPGSWDVIYLLSAPFAWMVQFWDKITLGNPLGYAQLFLLLHFLALARVLRGGGWRWLAVAFAAGLGSVLPHTALGLGMVPVTTGAVALGLLLRGRAPWLPDARSMTLFWLATMAGFAAGLPYLVSIASGWRNEASGLGQHWIEPGWRMPWSIVTACAVTSLFAWPGTRRAWDERRPLAAWISLWTLGVLLMQCIVHLPGGNEHKYIWLAFLTLSLLGGREFLPAMDRWRARLGSPGFAAVFTILFLVPPAALLQGAARDPMRYQSPALNPRPGEARMLAWVRDSTSVDDVFLETRNRDLLIVQGPRHMLVGTPAGPEIAAFPVREFERRREVTADLFGSIQEFDGDLASLTDVVARARQVQRVGVVYLLYRESDFAPGDAPWVRLEAVAGNRAVKRYDTDGFRIYALRLPGAS